jgi:hypothetical protein
VARQGRAVRLPGGRVAVSLWAPLPRKRAGGVVESRGALRVGSRRPLLGGGHDHSSRRPARPLRVLAHDESPTASKRAVGLSSWLWMLGEHLVDGRAAADRPRGGARLSRSGCALTAHAHRRAANVAAGRFVESGRSSLGGCAAGRRRRAIIPRGANESPSKPQDEKHKNIQAQSENDKHIEGRKPSSDHLVPFSLPANTAASNTSVTTAISRYTVVSARR